MGESDLKPEDHDRYAVSPTERQRTRSTGQRHSRNRAGTGHDGTSTLTVGRGRLARRRCGRRRGRAHDALAGPARGCADLRRSRARPGPRPQGGHHLAGLRSRLALAVRDRRQALLRRLQGHQEAGRPAPLRRPPNPDAHLAVGRHDRRGRLRAGDHGWPLGGPGAALRPHGAGDRGAAVAGGPGIQQRCAGVAAGRDQRLDPRRCPGQAGPRLGLAVHGPGPAVPVAGTADRAGRPGARHRRRADRLGLPGPVAHPDRAQALVPDRSAQGDAVPPTVGSS